MLVRGEFATEGTRMFLRADEHEIRVLLDDGVNAPKGVVDARGLFLDVGRLEAGDPRAGSFAEGRDADKWPRPGEELILRISATSETQPASGASVRSIAIEPWRYDGQTVTVTGNFRGRNLFGDLPGAPGKSKYDFVLRGTEGAALGHRRPAARTGIRPRRQPESRYRSLARSDRHRRAREGPRQPEGDARVAVQSASGRRRVRRTKCSPPSH